MLEVLTERKGFVIQQLIQALSQRNDDFEKTLNAQVVLQELADNEATFGNLVESRNLLSLIQAATDIRNTQNQSYACNVLSTIIKEFPDYEKQIGPKLA